MHLTKGIVLRVVQYGETSIIAKIFTLKFGLQSYLIKGIRKVSKKSASQINFFQPSALLQLNVYHNPLKNLQYLKSFEWSHMYHEVFFSVIKNGIAVYISELLSQVLKEPEVDEEIFELSEGFLLLLDRASPGTTANIPLIYTIKLAVLTGIGFNGFYNEETSVLDLQEGKFVAAIPQHDFYFEGRYARFCYEALKWNGQGWIESENYNRAFRRTLLEGLHKYFKTHSSGNFNLKSIEVLKEVL